MQLMSNMYVYFIPLTILNLVNHHFDSSILSKNISMGSFTQQFSVNVLAAILSWSNQIYILYMLTPEFLIILFLHCFFPLPSCEKFWGNTNFFLLLYLKMYYFLLSFQAKSFIKEYKFLVTGFAGGFLLGIAMC